MTTPANWFTPTGWIAAWHLPHQLVIRGVYRHVRNPFSAGVSAILLGESVLTASLPLLCWFGFYTLAKSLTIPLVIEPILVRRFGDQYHAYMQNVPRWIPRLTPWEGTGAWPAS